MGRTKEFDREQVLRKAMIVFWEKGYEGASIPDLLKSMELSRSSMYETFQDKQTLYYEAIQQYKKMSQKKRDLMNLAPSAITGSANILNCISRTRLRRTVKLTRTDV